MRFKLFILAFAFISVGADEIDWSQYNTEKDLATLTEEQLNSMPMNVLMRVYKDEGSFSNESLAFMTAFSLGRLGYFVDTNPRILKQKIKSFQETIGAEKTGELTYGQFNQLTDCVSKASENNVIPLAGTSVYFSDSFVSASASLVIDDGNDVYLEETDSAYPVTSSQIRCKKTDGYCSVFVADVSLPRFGDSNSTYYLNTNVDIWTIDSWGEDKLVASQGSECRVTTMTINGTSEEIVQTTTNASKEDCEVLGTTIPKLERPQIVKSVDPMEYTFGYWRARANKVTEMCVSDETRELGKSLNE